MFSFNRFDPNQHSAQSPQPAFDPLARLNQRLDKAKLQLDDQQHQQQTPQHPPEPSHNDSQTHPATRQLAPRSETSATPLHEQGDEQKQQPVSKKQKARIELGFTGPNSIPLPSQEGAADKKPKTSAKLKYLKKKKGRTKTRKLLLRQSNAAVKNEGAYQAQQEQGKLEAHAPLTSTENSVQGPSTVTTTKNSMNPECPTSSSTDPPKLPKRLKRPKNLDSALEKINKKKIKTKHDPATKDGQCDLTEPEEMKKESKKLDRQEVEECPELNGETMVIDQPGALPRFPAPTNSSRPDPRLLARLAMGLGYSRPSEPSSLDLQDFIHFESQSEIELDQIQQRPSNSSAHTALQPGSDASTPFSLSPHCVNRLSQQGFKSILAVQIAVLSILMPSLSHHEKAPATNFYPTRNPPRDLCVNAPTGSGKTLSYIIPIVETLKSRLVCRIRALIVLPTRDLVLQVKNTFDTFSSGTGLKAAILTGRHPFSREQALIGGTNDGLEGLVDVIIATPGRLLDHLNYTPGFSTDHLCFLVLDEADQLLNNKSQNWLHQILNHTRTNNDEDGPNDCNKTIVNHYQSNSSKHSHGSLLDLFDEKQEELLNQEDDFFNNPIHNDSRHDILKPGHRTRWTSRRQSQPSWTLPVETYNPCRLRPFRILLFSATLRRDPTQVDHLGLRSPIFIKVSSTGWDLEGNDMGTKDQLVTKNLDDSLDHLNGFSLPATLKQHIIVTRTDLKPLVFIKLVMRRKIKRALCFCKSIEGAGRLTSLCKLMFDGQDPSIVTKDNNGESNGMVENCDLFKVECFSSDLSPADRSKLLKSFQLGQVNMLICSDMIARGIDIAQVENVINYDAPIDMKKYVHRVGRTARANQLGFAFTLVESQEAKFVKNFLKLGLGPSHYHQLLVKLRFNWFDLEDLDPAYQTGLKKLAEKYGRSIDL